jgi:hypothetical protein
MADEQPNLFPTAVDSVPWRFELMSSWRKVRLLQTALGIVPYRHHPVVRAARR